MPMPMPMPMLVPPIIMHAVSESKARVNSEKPLASQSGTCTYPTVGGPIAPPPIPPAAEAGVEVEVDMEAEAEAETMWTRRRRTLTQSR